MPELPEPGSERPPEHMEYLATEADEAGKDAEEKTADLERLAALFSEGTGESFNVQYFPIEVPESARAIEVEPWPDGSPCVVFVHYPEREPEG